MTYPSTTLGKLCIDKPQYGANAKAIARTSESQPRYIRITDIDANGQLIPNGVAADVSDTSTYSLREGDLLIARSGNTVGKSYLHPKGAEPSLFAGYLIRFQLSPKRINPRFAFFFTKSERYNSWLDSKRRVAGQPNINGTEYASLEIPLPPLPEQDRIVEILEQADTLRQQRRQADALSQRILPALFHEMFGDVHTAHEKWPTKGITEVCWPRQWPTISGKQLLAEGYPVFGANGLIGYYDSFNHEHSTIAITCRGATCGTINLTPPKCYLTGNAMALDDLDESLVTQEFMIAFLECRGLQDVITGAAQPQITRTNLEKVKIPLVPSDLLMKFTEGSKKLTSARNNASTSATTIETLFQTLLHRAFDGSLTAKWREGQGKELLQEMEYHSKR